MIKISTRGVAKKYINLMIAVPKAFDLQKALLSEH